MFVRNVISSGGKSDIDTATPRSENRILSTPLEVFKEIFSPYKENGEKFLNHDLWHRGVNSSNWTKSKPYAKMLNHVPG